MVLRYIIEYKLLTFEFINLKYNMNNDRLHLYSKQRWRQVNKEQEI